VALLSNPERKETKKRSEIKTIQEKMETNQEKVDAIQEKMDASQEKVDAIQEKMDSEQEDMKGQVGSLASWLGRDEGHVGCLSRKDGGKSRGTAVRSGASGRP
jgi:chromosome segregation ATPase